MTKSENKKIILRLLDSISLDQKYIKSLNMYINDIVHYSGRQFAFVELTML